MPSAFVLNIGGKVGTGIELIRKISEPRSKSKPHITIRYVDVLSTNDLSPYENKAVSKIELIGAGSFGITTDLHQKNSTVFIECEAEELEDLVHKPHFPDSVFHITLYDGNSRKYASELLKVIRRNDWEFNLPFEKEVKLTKIEINKRKKKKANPIIEYSDDLHILFEKLFSKKLSFSYLEQLTDKQRLSAIAVVLNFLSDVAIDFPRTEIKITSDTTTKFVHNNNHNQHSLHPSDVESWFKKEVPENVKNTAFYLTPPELASDIVKVAINHLDDNSVRFGDPAIGTGVFFSALLNNLETKTLENGIGIEVDIPRAMNTQKKWNNKGLQVIDGDYLHLDELPKRNLIIANPPYIRYQNLCNEYSTELRQRASVILNDKISGYSGLYVYFILLSHNWIEENGISAWLIPSEFMENNFGYAIRKYLTNKVQLLQLHRFDDDKVQFENAFVSSTVVIFKNTKPNDSISIKLSKGNSLSSPVTEYSCTTTQLSNASKWSVPLREEVHNENKLILNDIFNIKRGIATGANSYFIMEESIAKERGIPPICLKHIIPKANSVDTNIIEASSDGTPLLNKTFVVFDSDIEEQELLSNYPDIKEYLDTADELELKSRTLIRRRNPWYKQEQRLPAPFLCTYMGRGSDTKSPIRFVKNNSKAISTNSFIMLYPKPELMNFIKQSKENAQRVFDLLLDIEQNTIASSFRTYSGGLKKVEPSDLKRVIIHSPPDWLLNLFP